MKRLVCPHCRSKKTVPDPIHGGRLHYVCRACHWGWQETPEGRWVVQKVEGTGRRRWLHPQTNMAAGCMLDCDPANKMKDYHPPFVYERMKGMIL